MKKITAFILLALAVMGMLGGIGYTLYNKAFIITIGIAFLGYLAYPKAKEMFKDLFDDKE